MTLIEYRSGLISLLSLDARSAFSPDRTQTTVAKLTLDTYGHRMGDRRRPGRSAAGESDLGHPASTHDGQGSASKTGQEGQNGL